MVLPERGVAVIVHRADGLSCAMAMMQVYRVLKKAAWEQPSIDSLSCVRTNWLSGQITIAMAALSALLSNVLFADSPALPPFKASVIDREAKLAHHNSPLSAVWSGVA